VRIEAVPRRVAVVPSEEHPTGYHVLERMAEVSTSLRAAIAFVTSTGVELVEELLAHHAPLAVQVVARGAPITEPSALLRLDSLGADVAVVIGARAHGFHPKLWLASCPGELHVLAGSGNLTAGGLRTNDEQFEYLRLTDDDIDLINEHERRFEAFADLAVPLSEVVGTTFWREWESQIVVRQQFADQERELDRRLALTAEASSAVAQLYADLLELYERTKVEVRIPGPDGGDRPYVASRFKQAIDRGLRDGTLVTVVARIVRERTEGFDHLAAANRPDLMVETTVLDNTKPYHRLFSAPTKAHAEAAMAAFYGGRRTT
jgi:HKD family nuclease